MLCLIPKRKNKLRRKSRKEVGEDENKTGGVRKLEGEKEEGTDEKS